MNGNNSEKFIYCNKCGKPNYPEANFCSGCGNNLNISFNSGEQSFNSSYQTSHHGMHDTYYGDKAPYEHYRAYAGFWRRFAALLIDGIILSLAGTLVGLIFGDPPSEIYSLVTMILGWLYYAVMESSEKQATLGKLALGIYVTDNYGNRITFGRATGRHFGKIISAFILLIGYIMAGFTEKKQALHDLMAGCLVLIR